MGTREMYERRKRIGLVLMLLGGVAFFLVIQFT
jgi:hypothetical protein